MIINYGIMSKSEPIVKLCHEISVPGKWDTLDHAAFKRKLRRKHKDYKVTSYCEIERRER